MKVLNKTASNYDELLTPSPFFSIIIATYNRAGLLKRAVESLISQTEIDWEAVIVDDGSTDETYEVMLPYLKAYSKIKYIKKRHGGEAITKNLGIWAAKGAFITFLDSDDEYHPAHLAIRKTILKQNPKLDFLYGGVYILGNQFVPNRFDYSKNIDLNDCVIGGSFFVSRKTLLILEGFRDIPIGTDADLFDRAEEIQVDMLEVQQRTYIYHHETQDSITNSMCLDR